MSTQEQRNERKNDGWAAPHTVRAYEATIARLQRKVEAQDQVIEVLLAERRVRTVEAQEA